jgi:hypothetical protein
LVDECVEERAVLVKGTAFLFDVKEVVIKMPQKHKRTKSLQSGAGNL